MTDTAPATATTTTSPDGAEIGYWTSGVGPPLVLVHGMSNARIEVLANQQHTGDVLAPAAFARVLTASLDDEA